MNGDRFIHLHHMNYMIRSHTVGKFLVAFSLVAQQGIPLGGGLVCLHSLSSLLFGLSQCL